MKHFKSDGEALQAVRDWLMAFPALPMASRAYYEQREEMREAVERQIRRSNNADRKEAP